MSETVNKFFWLVINSCLKCIENSLVLLIVLVVHLSETKKGLQNLCRQEIQTLFTKMSFIRLVFSMI